MRLTPCTLENKTMTKLAIANKNGPRQRYSKTSKNNVHTKKQKNFLRQNPFSSLTKQDTLIK